MNAELAARPPGERRVVVFVHGYNNNFSEGLYRQAQMVHDFGTPAVAVHYSWPSAADARLYLYDRDSAFFARDGLEELLRLLARTRAERIVLVGHSMGGQVVVEALRQMALVGAPEAFGKLYAVVLLSPDVDVDLFRSSVRPLARLDLPWFVFVSSRDRALRMSSFVRGQRDRLGSIADVAEVGDLDITVIDVSGVDSADPLGHETVATSPVMISLIRGLSAYGPRDPRGRWPRLRRGRDDGSRGRAGDLGDRRAAGAVAPAHGCTLLLAECSLRAAWSSL